MSKPRFANPRDANEQALLTVAGASREPSGLSTVPWTVGSSGARAGCRWRSRFPSVRAWRMSTPLRSVVSSPGASYAARVGSSGAPRTMSSAISAGGSWREDRRSHSRVDTGQAPATRKACAVRRACSPQGLHSISSRHSLSAPGQCHAPAHDASPDVRQRYALQVAFRMSELHGLDAGYVHELMLQIDEYREVAPDLVPEEAL